MITEFSINLNPLDWSTLKQLSEPSIRLVLSEECREKISSCRTYLEDKITSVDAPVYGINTGFGALHSTRIGREDMEQLQLNLMMSHACGTGREMPEEIVRWMLFLKIRSLAYGHSGIDLETVQRLIDFYNAGVYPVIWSQGSLGASGDLAPLAHLSLPLLGLGEVMCQGVRMSGAEALKQMGWEPIRLKAKEGLALLNGTQFMLACAIYACIQGQRQCNQADLIAALSLDAFDCRQEPFHPLLHKIRPHKGQVSTAEAICKYRQDSEIANAHKVQVQDPYSFRCIPQIHGASKDTLDFVLQSVLTEVNSVTDNPNIFPEEDLILSGGNFHGQILAMAMDFLAIALAELGSVSERRTYLLLSGQRGLPAFLVRNPGLNSGLMIMQYLAASIVNRNKQHCTPASVDSIPSSNGQEDHVSMGANAGVKLLEVSENLDTLLGIEAIHASQALSFRAPLKSSPQLEKWVENFRTIVPLIENDRILSGDIRTASEGLRSNRI